jgi:uncharacterized membrane protein
MSIDLLDQRSARCYRRYRPTVNKLSKEVVVVVEEQRLQDLERRMRRIERQLGVHPARPAPASAPPPPRPAPRPAPAPERTVRPPSEPGPQTRDLEQLLGGRVLAWVGGAAVVAGLALLLALGISQGWIGEQARVLLGGGLSLLLLVAGVWLHDRRGHAQAARATAAAGICGLFMTFTVAGSGYHLLGAGAGLTLAFATGAVAAFLALRWSSPLVGGLGIAGAVLAPVLVGAPSSGITVAFEAIAVASAATVLLRARWDWLALAVFGLSAPQWLSWLFETRTETGIIVVLLAFGSLYVVAALGFELRIPSERLRSSPAFLLGINALTLAVAGWFSLTRLGAHDVALLWLATLATGHVAAGVAALRSKRISHDLGLLCLTLAVVLADVAFALSVGGTLRTVGFAAGGVAFALGARRLRASGDAVMAELGLGGHIAISAMQALHDIDSSQLLAPGAAGSAIAGLVAVAAGCLVSARVAEEGRTGLRTALDATGLAALAGIALLALEGPMLTIAWATQAVALARIGSRRDDPVARAACFVHLAAAALFALVDQAPPDGLIEGATDLGPAVLGLGAVAVATLGCAFALATGDPVRRVLMAAGPGVALYLASLTVVALSPAAADGGAVQQGQLQLSALWSITGVAALVLGLRRASRELRLAALALLGLAVGKVFLYDLAALTSVYRVGSFLGLGLLLLFAALAYQRMRPEVLVS